MTSQPLVASVCVDYLSHPLSAEHLLVCYQQITRQITHAPKSAKDAAISYQHQSQTLLELLGQHQNLAIPTTNERPAPVGCQSQLKRMQNALWRRSSQSSLAKDVALVHPESLNWQKECDVLWLYGPLYEFTFLQQQEQQRRFERKGPSSSQREWMEAHRERAHVQLELPPQSPPVAIPDDAIAEHSITPSSSLSSAPAAPAAPVAAASTASVESSAATEATTTASVDAPSSEAMVAALDAFSITLPSTSDNLPTAPTADDATTTTTTATNTMPVADLINSSPIAESTLPTTSIMASSSATPLIPAAPVDADAEGASNALLCAVPRSALKQQRTRMQVFEDLRAFTRSSQYLALTESLAITFENSSSSLSTPSSASSMALLTYTEGSRSEPLSPTTPNVGPAFVLPVFPVPTKYHFRSHDRRRASFPKSASHPSRLNVSLNVNLNMSVRVNNNGCNSCGEMLSPGGTSVKHLRFSLEVQELVFLPTSPPFRISRAKPTRAHSDPAIQTTTCSSFIAPSHADFAHLPPQQSTSHHNGSWISTTAASGISVDNANSNTTFIKVHPEDGSRIASGKKSAARLYLQPGDDDYDDEDALECTFNDDFHDDCYFEDCREDDGFDDDEDDEFNGMIGSRRLRLSAKDSIVARRTQPDERRGSPGVLWQVYTAVTGVKELIAWYGSMVYHSSSL
ncbi:hypothetical protein BGZ98_000591 [Dissophora globulifera]|nr:hypothetical protein BGZ98_000591 [Dissophora globulifera]